MSDPFAEQKPKGFTTSSGVFIKFVGVPPLLLAKLQSAGKLPPVPTRKIPLDFGDMGEESFQEEELNEDDLQDDDEKKRWKAYTTERDAVLSKRNENFLKAIFALGVEIEMKDLESWKETMEYLGLDIPTNPKDLKVQYIETEIIHNTTEMVDIIVGVMGESGVPEEELESMRSMFLGTVRRGAAGESVAPEGEVAVVSEIQGDESGALLGDLASIGILQGE